VVDRTGVDKRIVEQRRIVLHPATFRVRAVVET
jgi:hypothetical protein